jgi:hypothetical protein
VNASSFLSRTATLGAALTAGLAAMAAGPTESGTDRPGGVYAYVPAEDAAGCAIACAQDQICLAWSFKATEYVGCSLKAIVPASTADPEIQSGVAPRAAAFLALTSLSQPAMSAPASAAPKPAPKAAAPRVPAIPPSAPSAPLEPSLLGASLEIPADDRFQAFSPAKIAALAPLDRVSARPLAVSVALASIPASHFADEPETIETPTFKRFALLAPLTKIAATPLPARSDMILREPAQIPLDTPTVQLYAALAPLSTVKPIALRVPAALAPQDAELIETIEAPPVVKIAAIAPLRKVTAPALPVRSTASFGPLAALAEPVVAAPTQYTQVALLTPAKAQTVGALPAQPAAAPADDELLGGPDTP